MSQSADNLKAELAVSIDINELSLQMDSLIKKEELIEKMISQSKSLTQEQMKRSFDDLWKTVADEILKKNDRKGNEIDIKASVENIITAQLESDAYGYNKKKNYSPNTDQTGFDVLDSYVTKGDQSRLKEKTGVIIEQTGSHCRIVREGKKYDQKDAETLFNELRARIKQLKEKGLDTSLDYKVDLMIHMEELAVKNFTLNHNTYEKRSSPQALLQKKKKLYYKIFETKLGEGNALVEMMKDIVESN